MDENIKNTNKPLLLLYLLIEKNKDTDCCNIIRIFMTYHSSIFLNYNILKMNVLSNKNKSKELIKNYYLLVRNQINLLNKLKKVKTKFNKKNFWNKDLNYIANYLKNLNCKFLSIFECNKSLHPFYLKLDLIYNESNIIFFTNIIYERLKDIYNLFGYKFFKNHNLVLINELEFVNLEYINKINYLSYIFLKISNYLNKYIYIVDLYVINKEKLNILLDYNIIPMEISIETFDSEEEYDIF